MPSSKCPWTTKKRRRRSKKKGGSNANRNLPRNEAADSLAADAEENEKSASDRNEEAEIEVPSSAVLPARRVGDSVPIIVLPVKTEPTDLTSGETSLNSHLHKSDDLPLNSQEAVSKNSTFSAHISQPKFENCKENMNHSSSEMNLPRVKIKEEPIDPGYDFALTASKRNVDMPSDVIDDNGYIRKKLKVVLTDCAASIANLSNVKATEQCSQVVSNENDDCKSVISTSVPPSFTDDSSSADTVLNMPIENMDVEKNTVFPSLSIEIKQESNSIADISTEDKTDKFSKYGLVYIKKEPESNSIPSLTSAQLKEDDKTVINMSNVIDPKVLNEILSNISLKNESVNAVNIPQSSVRLESMNITKTLETESNNSCSSVEKISCLDNNKSCSHSITKTVETESNNRCSSVEKMSCLDNNKPCSHSITKTVETESNNSCSSGEKMSCLGNKPCSNSSFSISSWNSSESEQMEKSKTMSSAEWHSRNTSSEALSSNPNSRLTSSNTTVGSLKKLICLDFDLSDVLKALECLSKRTVNKPNKVLYPRKRKGMPMDVNVKLTNSQLPNIEKEIADFISIIKNGEKSEKVALSECKSRVKSDSQQEIMDTDRIVSPVGSHEPSLTRTCSDTSVQEDTSANYKSLFTPTKKLDLSKTLTFSGNVRPVLPSSELPAKTDQISSEQLKRIMNMFAKENALSSNLSPCYTSNTSAEIPCVAANAKQSVEINCNNNPCDSTYDHSRSSVMNRPIKNFSMNCTDREHNFVSPPFVENESANASFVARTESFRTQSVNMGPLNNMDNRNTDFKQISIPTSYIGNTTGIPSFIPPTKSFSNQDLSLGPGSSRNQVVNKVTEMTRTNNYQYDLKSTPHAAKSASLSFAHDSVVNHNASRQIANVAESTNVHSVHSPIHRPCSYQNSKEGSSPENVSFSDIRAKLEVPRNVEKRKITTDEYIQRSKLLRVDNVDKRKLNSDYQLINSAKSDTMAKESLRMDSNHVRDPRLRRNITSSTMSDVAPRFVPTAAASGHVHSSSLNSGISNLLPSDIIFTSQALKCLPPSSSKSAPSMGSSALINDESVVNKKRIHIFKPPPYAASNMSPPRTPIAGSTCLASSETKSPVLLPISQPERFIHRNIVSVQNAVHSTHQVTSEPVHRQSILSQPIIIHRDFLPHRGHVVGVKQWHSNIGKKIVSTSDVLHFILEWNCHWLRAQKKTQNCPPICNHYNKVKDNYDSVTDYYNTYFPLYMLNIWLEIYNSWRCNRYPVYELRLNSCDESNYVKVSCTIAMSSSQLNDFLKREEIVYVKFTKDGKEDALFGYIFMVGEKPDTTRNNENWKKVMVSFHTAEKLYIPLGSIVQMQKLENVRVLLKQHDALRSLEYSPYKEIILKPKEHASKISVVTLPYDTLKTSGFIRIIASYTNTRNCITLVDVPPSIDRTSVISNLVLHLIDRESRVLVCLKDRKALVKLANKILQYVKPKRFILALKPSEIKLPDSLVPHTLRERMKIGGKEPSESELASLCAHILKQSSVILTVLSSVFFSEGKSALAELNLKCIIDDATSCTEAETMLPLYYNVGHLVLIGDPQKEILLHPNLQKYSYHKSLFSRLYKVKTVL